MAIFKIRMQLKWDILNDIRFWIILFFIVRLFGITNPPLEVGHNWRQTTVTMVARNFMEVDNDMLYPRVDIAGEKTGITGMEFPIFNYVIYCVSDILGYDHWYGRIINLLVSSFGVWFFFLLIRKYFDEPVAFPSAVILLVSIWFQYSRKIMPDTFSMSFVITGIYYGSQYLDSVNRKYSLLHIGIYAVSISIGVLAKLPSGFMLVVFVFFILDKSLPAKRRILFSLVSVLVVIPVTLWYMLWVPHLVERFGFWHFFMGQDVVTGLQEIIHFIPKASKNFYDSALKFVGFGLFLFGLFSIWKARNKYVAAVFLICLLGFSCVIIKAGRTFVNHDYYVIPFVPVMALVAGYGLSCIRIRGLANVLLLVVSIEGIANQQHDFFIRDKERSILKLESDLDKVSNRSDLILINSGNYPTPMYFAHRKGWVMPNEAIADSKCLDSLACLGLKYVVILKRTFGSEVRLDPNRKVLDNDDYAIYSWR